MNAAAPAPLWPHQRDAVAAAVTTLAREPRATILAACGSGKTRIGTEIAARLLPEHGRLLLTAPSVELLAQTVHEHRRGRRDLGRVIAVCSDRGALARLEDDPGMADAEITTDPALLTALL